jgi:hypothetical protein
MLERFKSALWAARRAGSTWGTPPARNATLWGNPGPRGTGTRLPAHQLPRRHAASVRGMLSTASSCCRVYTKH